MCKKEEVFPKPIGKAAENMANKLFDIPGFTFFKEKNVYSGSVSQLFNYKIWFGDEFTVKVWYGEKCFSKTPEEEIKAVFTAPFVPESLAGIENWLNEQYEIYKKSRN